MGAEPDCDAPHTTIEMNRCASLELERAEMKMQQYLSASREKHEEDIETVTALAAAQAAWETYKVRHCQAIHTLWRDGTIRGVMALGCSIKLTHERAHELWLQYLADDPAQTEPEK